MIQRVKSMKFGRMFVIVGAVAVTVASCSGGDENAATGASETTLVAEDGTSANEFSGLWEQYLEAYDEAIVDGSVPSDLVAVASDEAIVDLETIVEDNSNKVDADDFDAILEVESSMNPVSFTSGARPVLKDCTTHLVKSTLGEPFEIFADQRVTFVGDGAGGWVIDEVEVVQDGWLSQDFGCIPKEYSDAAVSVAEEFQNLSLGLEQNPPVVLPAAMLDISSEELEEVLELGRQSLVSSGYYSDSPTDVVVESVGLNFRYASADGPVVRVESCVSYPEGQELKLVGSDDVAESPLGPGESVGASLDVLVREGFVGEVVAVSPSASGVC